MWKRSDVELLTGLERHTIQDLCNKNTTRGGLGFWEPAVMKPGYSRFDEGDLLAFYLVRQFTKVGLPPACLGDLVSEMLEDGDVLLAALRKQEGRLNARRDELDDQIEAIGRLEDAATRLPGERLRAMMERELLASAERAVGVVVGECPVAPEQRKLVERSLHGLAVQLARSVWESDLPPEVRLLRERFSRLREDGVDPDDPSAREALVGGCSNLLVRALDAFLCTAGNGVAVELALGKGAYAYLRKVVATHMSESRS